MAMRSYSIFSFILIATFQLFFVAFGENIGPVMPPRNVDQKALLQSLSLDNANINLSALYIFGDSFVDVGNNNFLDAGAKANFPPFGVDFGAKATGRNSNGRLAVDFIAQAAGLPFAPPMLSLSNADKTTILTGINYASSSTGILPDTGSFMGDILPFDKQINLFESTTKDLKSQFNTTHSYNEYMSKSLFFIHMAANDLGIGWDLGNNKAKYTPDSYAQILIQELSKRLQRLYDLGARKFLVHNVFPLGCQPFNINKFHPSTPCLEEVNSRISIYNKLLPSLLSNLQSTLYGAKFSLGDLYKVFEDVLASPTSFGFTDVKSLCCVDLAGDGTMPCIPNRAPCTDRSTHLFFDAYHATERMHFIWTKRCFEDTSVCSPNFVQLIQA